ncbi:MAG: glycosyltransferase family 2 protein [Chloroflexi bacterium]|nr:glycosyltransferase family 2 protein [Chloroflexota bacterium]MCC6894873.1 glycosyl transferase [Anaerolineae bacterium]
MKIAIVTIDPQFLSALYVVAQILFAFGFLTMLYFFTRSVNWVDTTEAYNLKPSEYPKIILFYPVLREAEDTMRTTMLGLSKMDYPKDKFRIIAIPNWNDTPTITSIRQLMTEFSFLEIIEMPPTTDVRWGAVWKAWEKNPKAYWWHQGKNAHVRDLPPKKTRQMIYAFYQIVEKEGDDWVLDYIDADSVPPTDHFLAAAAGLQKFDVLQSTNVAGNLLDSWAATFHAMDHMCWDGLVYPHLSADGKHPFWVLGKGLFFRARDLVQVGGFHPWITIEDPEVGMRLWTNGKKIGIIENPLIEEVPVTLKMGITQRKRWTCGFYQSLSGPLTDMGMNFRQRQLARMNLIPCLSLTTLAIGLPTSIWAFISWLQGSNHFTLEVNILSIVNILSYIVLMSVIYYSTWKRTALVLNRSQDRLLYMFRVNPIFMWVYWLIWIVPIFKGLNMFVFDLGKIWERTLKENRNNDLVREKLADVPITAEQPNWLILSTGENPILEPAKSIVETAATTAAAASSWHILNGDAPPETIAAPIVASNETAKIIGTD